MREGNSSLINPEEALAQYKDMVYRLALVQMKSESDADDVFQEVFLRLVRYTDRIQGEAHLKHWLIRVTLNCCKKQYASAWRRKTVSMDTEVCSEDSYEMQERDDTVIKAVAALPKRYRYVIHLFYYEQYAVKEIAQILGQSESSIKTRLSRARDMLRNTLKGGSADAREI